MAMKEPTHQQLIETLDCAIDQWKKFGNEMIEVLKQHPYLSAYLKPLVKKYSESCAEMREKIDSWPDAPSHEKPDI